MGHWCEEEAGGTRGRGVLEEGRLSRPTPGCHRDAAVKVLLAGVGQFLRRRSQTVWLRRGQSCSRPRVAKSHACSSSSLTGPVLLVQYSSVRSRGDEGKEAKGSRQTVAKMTGRGGGAQAEAVCLGYLSRRLEGWRWTASPTEAHPENWRTLGALCQLSADSCPSSRT